MFPEPISNYIHQMGWFPGRALALPETLIDYPDNALLILKEFNGLHFRPSGSAGKECGTGDILIDYGANRLLVNSEQEILARYGIRCFFVGISHCEYSEIYSDSKGVIYSSDIIDDDLGCVGPNIYEAINNIITGIRMRPIFKPGQTSVTFYGESYSIDDHRVYTP